VAEPASPDVEQTLALVRDQAERDIARYRTWLAVVTFTTSLVMQLVRLAVDLPQNWISPTVRFAFILYALAVRSLVRRVGARDSLIYATLLIDCFLGSGNAVVQRWFTSEATSTSTAFVPYVSCGWMVLIVLINTLRNHRTANVVAFAAGAMTLLGLLHWVEGLKAVHVGPFVVLCLAAAVAFAATRQSRRQLELFARLQLLRRFLPAPAVSRVLADAPKDATAIGGELQTVTVMATDLRGFTRMSERLEPGEVLRQLNAYHAAMLEQIDAHGGSLDKFIGDGALVVFGIRAFGQAGDPDRGANAAVRCCAAMLGALEKLNAERKAAGAAPLAMGIGVHTGPVVVGNLGVPARRLEFTVIGDTVNTAARLESYSKEAGTPVIISATTAELLEGRSALKALPAAQLRGREAALDVFTLAPTA
jgi:adenylate cyclase